VTAHTLFGGDDALPGATDSRTMQHHLHDTDDNRGALLRLALAALLTLMALGAAGSLLAA
jgi:hypothetical protein